MKPMLAHTIEDLEKIVFPVLASPKLDGIRCLMIDGKAYSRNMKLIPNAHIQARLAGLHGLDGELIVGSPCGNDVFNRSTSGVMSRDGTPKFHFWAFDMFADHHVDDAYEARLAAAKRACAVATKEAVHVSHVRINSVERLLAYEAKMLLAGYEGIMLRDPRGPYKQGRSTQREGYLGKLKRFSDSEARILGFVEQMRNDNVAKKDALGRTERSSHKENKHGKGTLGALEVEDITSGVRFEVGTGFDDRTRQAIWDDQAAWLGQVIKYKFMPVGVKEKPRFPVYLGLRKD